MSERKKKILGGLSHGTARARLLQDLLWHFIQKDDCACFRCGLPMTRETFSIDHEVNWIGSDDPVTTYFDLNNIRFSHLKCNVKAAKKREPVHGTPTRYKKGCRCDNCVAAKAVQRKKYYDPKKRNLKFKRLGT